MAWWERDMEALALDRQLEITLKRKSPAFSAETPTISESKLRHHGALIYPHPESAGQNATCKVVRAIH